MSRCVAYVFHGNVTTLHEFRTPVDRSSSQSCDSFFFALAPYSHSWGNVASQTITRWRTHKDNWNLQEYQESFGNSAPKYQNCAFCDLGRILGHSGRGICLRQLQRRWGRWPGGGPGHDKNDSGSVAFPQKSWWISCDSFLGVLRWSIDYPIKSH